MVQRLDILVGSYAFLELFPNRGRQWRSGRFYCGAVVSDARLEVFRGPGGLLAKSIALFELERRPSRKEKDTAHHVLAHCFMRGVVEKGK